MNDEVTVATRVMRHDGKIDPRMTHLLSHLCYIGPCTEDLLLKVGLPPYKKPELPVLLQRTHSVLVFA